jgi:CBS domain-containing protein
MDTVKEILEGKDGEIWSIMESQSVYDAIARMAEVGVGALPVLTEEARLVGIISERDYARKVILDGKSSQDTPVADIMTRDVVFVNDDTTVDKCMALMSHHKIRHLPIMHDAKLTGIVTAGDVMKFMIRKQSNTIEELESYIMEERGGSG